MPIARASSGNPALAQFPDGGVWRRVRRMEGHVFTQKQVREALGIPHRRVEKLIRFDYDEVMAWAKRWSQEAGDHGIHAMIDSGEQRRSLQQALISLPV